MKDFIVLKNGVQLIIIWADNDGAFHELLHDLDATERFSVSSINQDVAVTALASLLIHGWYADDYGGMFAKYLNMEEVTV